jgi:hypothetical protein
MFELLKDDHLSTRDKIFALEAMMKEQPQVECPIVEYFSHGVYAREVHIPAGALVTGEIHKLENLNILSQGEMSVLVGDQIQRISAPFAVVSPPGTKRIAFAHTDCVWTTIHGTFEKDTAKIKEIFIASSEEAYLEYTKQIEGSKDD